MSTNTAFAAFVTIAPFTLGAVASCSRNGAGTKQPGDGARFALLLRQRSPNGLRKHAPAKTYADVQAMSSEIDSLYLMLVQANDIDALKEVLDIKWFVASSLGVFGIMEVANRNYSTEPDAGRIRKKALRALAELLSDPNPDVRGAALYAVGKMRRHECKELVARCMRDGEPVDLFFPALVEFDHTMSTTVRTLARKALEEMRGKRKKKDEGQEPGGAEPPADGGWN